MRYLYPKSQAQAEGTQSIFLKASPEGKAFKGQIMQPFAMGKILAAFYLCISEAACND